jgi:hypothetical protein
MRVLAWYWTAAITAARGWSTAAADRARGSLLTARTWIDGLRFGSFGPPVASTEQWSEQVTFWLREALRLADKNVSLTEANAALTEASAALLAAHEELRTKADEAFAELSVRRAYDAREPDLFSVQERIVELSRMARNPWAPVATHVTAAELPTPGFARKERNGNGNH